MPSAGYFEPLGFTNVSQTAMIVANARGLGLNDYLWKQMVNLLHYTDATVQSDIQCSSSLDGLCHLSQSCATYTNLWAYSFKLQIAGQSNYLNVPLGAFAVNNATSGGCDLYIEYLQSN